MKLKHSFVGAVLVMSCLAGYTHADDHKKLGARVQPYVLPYDVINFTDNVSYNTTFHFSTGIGSGAYHFPGDRRNILYTSSDRGPNIKCSDSAKVIGAEVCAKGKIFPSPLFTPSIFKFEYSPRKGFQLVDTIKLKDASGKVINGLPNPLVITDTELAFDKQGKPLEFDPNGVDTEALLKLSDGSFWLADEYAPSLLHVSPSGEVLQRVVPVGIVNDLAGADYPVTGVLPEILRKRKLNRGIESVAVSPDEQYLYFMLQSPLANPDGAAYKKSRNIRVFKMERMALNVVGEWVYRLDLPETFIADPGKKQKNVKVSEMVAIDMDTLVVLERISKTTKLYRIELSDEYNILNSRWDKISTSPSLEQISDLALANITPLKKELILDSAIDYPGVFPSKVEGIGLMDEHTLILVNDNDFGIKGTTTEFVRLRLRGDLFD